MNRTFIFHADPGHGWLAVDMEAIKAIGMTLKDFSRYSYRRDSAIYLEEDCDAPKFIDGWKKAGHAFVIQTINYKNDCFIRRLRCLHSIRFSSGEVA